MTMDDQTPIMSQKIFNLNLAVETVSLYLLCCALTDAGAAITVTALEEKWNGSREDLLAELDNLGIRRIIEKVTAIDDQESVYRVLDEKHWQ